jgi:hypothetical protein
MMATDKYFQKVVRSLRNPNHSLGRGTIDVKVRLWSAILRRYTQTRLSKCSDKLPALSGIVQYLRDIFIGEYHAGIWNEPIHLFLSWRSMGLYDGKNLRPRPATYRAPTWSWASTDNQVKDISTYRWVLSDAQYLLKVLEVETTLSTADSTGSVSSGHLLVQGPLNKLISTQSSWTSPLQFSHIIELDADDPEFCVWVYYDEPFSLLVGPQGHVEAYVLPLYRTPQHSIEGSPWMTVFLVLQTSKEAPGTYVRIGIGETNRDVQEKLMFVHTGADAPCEEYLGSKEGHRIRIV